MRQHLLGVLRSSRGRVRVFAVAGAFGAFLLVASPVTAGGKAELGCPPSFDIGAVTLEESLALPRLQAGLDAGAFTASDIAALFVAIDHNGDGVLCFQDIGALTDASHWQYFYNGVDNKVLDAPS